MESKITFHADENGQITHNPYMAYKYIEENEGKKPGQEMMNEWIRLSFKAMDLEWLAT